jgi:hypothetical protein
MTRLTDQNTPEGPTMEKKPERIRIQLTAEQKKQIKDASGEDVDAIELTAEELEDRIAPVSNLF